MIALNSSGSFNVKQTLRSGAVIRHRSPIPYANIIAQKHCPMFIDIALNLSVTMKLSGSTYCYGENKKLRSDSSLTQLASIIHLFRLILHPFSIDKCF